MSDEGGEARLVYEPSMKVYDGTDSAGIKGRAEINAELLGFSFKVVGDPVSNINFFKENNYGFKKFRNTVNRRSNTIPGELTLQLINYLYVVQSTQ